MRQGNIGNEESPMPHVRSLLMEHGTDEPTGDFFSHRWAKEQKRLKVSVFSFFISSYQSSHCEFIVGFRNPALRTREQGGGDIQD